MKVLKWILWSVVLVFTLATIGMWSDPAPMDDRFIITGITMLLWVILHRIHNMSSPKQDLNDKNIFSKLDEPNSVQKIKQVECTKCNTTIDSTAKFCPQCGQRVVNNRMNEYIVSKKNTDNNTNYKSRNSVVIIVFIGIGLLLYAITQVSKPHVVSKSTSSTLNNKSSNSVSNTTSTNRVRERYERDVSKYKEVKQRYDETVRYNNSRMVPDVNFYGVETGYKKHIYGFDQQLEDASKLGTIEAELSNAYINMEASKISLEAENK